jgi:hypothetical protein
MKMNTTFWLWSNFKQKSVGAWVLGYHLTLKPTCHELFSERNKFSARHEEITIIRFLKWSFIYGKIGAGQ